VWRSALLATAENDTVRAIRASAATVPTNIPGIHTYAKPPKGFNPVTAMDVELATYGFPPRPDKQVHPGQYARWERAMRMAKIRWNGELRPAMESLPISLGVAADQADQIGGVRCSSRNVMQVNLYVHFVKFVRTFIYVKAGSKYF